MKQHRQNRSWKALSPRFRGGYPLLLGGIVLLFLLLAACAAPAAPPSATEPAAEPAPEQATDTFKIACVAVSPKEDLTWNYAHWQGCNEAADAVGAELGWIDSVSEGPEAERVIRDFASKGYDLIFTTSFGFMDSTITVAQEFPDTWFVHISGYKTAPNVSTVFGRQYQAKYLAGMVAGSMTQTNILGLPAAHPIPEVIRLANAFLLGAQAVNPDVTMKVVWTNSWYDPPLEAEATEALIEAGADVIGHDVGTTKNCEVAREKGVWCVGYHTDFCAVANLCDVQLTSSVWKWGTKYTQIAQAVMAGTYQSESYWGGLKDGIVDIAPIHEAVPDEVRQMVAEKRKQIEDGAWDVFCGPLYDQAGELRVPEGQCMSDEEMLNIDWFVQGVKGEIE